MFINLSFLCEKAEGGGCLCQIFIDIPAWGDLPTVALLYALVAVRMIPPLKRAADVLPTGLNAAMRVTIPRSREIR